MEDHAEEDDNEEPITIEIDLTKDEQQKESNVGALVEEQAN